MLEYTVSGVDQLAPRQNFDPSRRGGAAELTESFGAFLNNALNKVGEQQKTVERLNQLLIAGIPTDVHQIMIAAEKAYLGLALTVEVRNKVLEAHHEIMRMQI